LSTSTPRHLIALFLCIFWPSVLISTSSNSHFLRFLLKSYSCVFFTLNFNLFAPTHLATPSRSSSNLSSYSPTSLLTNDTVISSAYCFTLL
jgi:hypothetical protein